MVTRVGGWLRALAWGLSGTSRRGQGVWRLPAGDVGRAGRGGGGAGDAGSGVGGKACDCNDCEQRAGRGAAEVAADRRPSAGGTPGTATATARGGHGRQLFGLGLAAPVGEEGALVPGGGPGRVKDGPPDRDGGEDLGLTEAVGLACCAHASTVCRHTQGVQARTGAWRGDVGHVGLGRRPGGGSSLHAESSPPSSRQRRPAAPPLRASAYMPARTAARVRARWHVGGEAVKGRSTRRRARHGCGLPQSGAPLERGRAGAPRSRGAGGERGRQVAPTTRSRSRCASGAPSSSFIRTASARPSTHRQVLWRARAGRRGQAGAPLVPVLDCQRAPRSRAQATPMGTTGTVQLDGRAARPGSPEATEPIGFLDVHGEIDRGWVAWPPYNLCT